MVWVQLVRYNRGDWWDALMHSYGVLHLGHHCGGNGEWQHHNNIWKIEKASNICRVYIQLSELHQSCFLYCKSIFSSINIWCPMCSISDLEGYLHSTRCSVQWWLVATVSWDRRLSWQRKARSCEPANLHSSTPPSQFVIPQSTLNYRTQTFRDFYEHNLLNASYAKQVCTIPMPIADLFTP